MLSFGRSENELLARNVCAKLSKVIAEDAEDGKEIATKSAEAILDRVRNHMKDESLAKAIEKELYGGHPGHDWTFKK